MPKKNQEILSLIPDPAEIESIKEVILANSVMCGEIPAPTFEEGRRLVFMRDRFTEAGMEHISVDEKDNVAAILPGSSGNRKILLSANLDTIHYAGADHSMTLGTDSITGRGICENSLGLGVLSALPLVLERLNVKFESDLLLVGTSQSIGVGNLGGIRFFLDNYRNEIDFGICLRAVQLGRLSYASLGMLRGEIQIEVPEEYDWKRLPEGSAIVILNRLITRLQEIPLPTNPVTTINLGSVLAGNTFGTAASTATLRFEIKSEEEGRTEAMEEQIEEIVEELAAENEVSVSLNVVARRNRGGISFSHPLVKTTRSIIGSLGGEQVIAPSTGELCALIDKGIPAVTVGLTKGEHLHERNETLKISPIYRGVSQLIGLLRAIDKGYCDE
ncbi:peptidase dimerization domain-containing protein [Puniceicoccus vermicola]|uniref:Peptidase dimerization domain-containing protein n=1 Tax=Puniceicoccus vermicola TaxID=388746 RepID=A0A7X1E5H8_9BACT|nr:peptidase dimerization domain-containing protein [Puniceicoccus vermicola]MBC2603665.1 peptidase dimerization domain-containing protein [Puniceicoccus vermicola]